MFFIIGSIQRRNRFQQVINIPYQCVNTNRSIIQTFIIRISFPKIKSFTSPFVEFRMHRFVTVHSSSPSTIIRISIPNSQIKALINRIREVLDRKTAVKICHVHRNPLFSSQDFVCNHLIIRLYIQNIRTSCKRRAIFSNSIILYFIIYQKLAVKPILKLLVRG